MDSVSHGDEKTFKGIFKFYRRKNRNIDLTNVYDFNQYRNDGTNCHFQDNVQKFHINASDVQLNWESTYGMIHPQNWEIFHFPRKPGLIYIKNPFKACGQRYWIVRCLKDFTRKPNPLNIDAHGLISDKDDWWEFCQRECNSECGKTVLKKLRWATLGYHHNWNTKEYSENARGSFPEDLKVLCKDLGKVLGFHNFNAEAAIINMYHSNSCLHGHVDHSEQNLEAPLFSFSLGQPAIFLIGGRSVNEEVEALLLESGDIIIMSKDARLYYHGVPCILKTTKQPWNTGISDFNKFVNTEILNVELCRKVGNDMFWKPFEMYVRKSRINMNIRQVLNPSQEKLSL